MQICAFCIFSALEWHPNLFESNIGMRLKVSTGLSGALDFPFMKRISILQLRAEGLQLSVQGCDSELGYNAKV